MTDPTPLDISDIPALRHLVEEMREKKQPRLLKQDRESVALLMPLGTLLKQQLPVTKEGMWADYDAGKVRGALAQSAGTLTGINKERLMRNIQNERSQDTRHRPF